MSFSDWAWMCLTFLLKFTLWRVNCNWHRDSICLKYMLTWHLLYWNILPESAPFFVFLRPKCMKDKGGRDCPMSKQVLSKSWHCQNWFDVKFDRVLWCLIITYIIDRNSWCRAWHGASPHLVHHCQAHSHPDQSDHDSMSLTSKYCFANICYF